MTDTLDMMIAGTAPTEVRVVAERVLQKLDDKYVPIIEESMSLFTDIPEDPIALGLSQFNLRLSRARSDANKVSQYMIAVTSERSRARERVKDAKTAYDEKLQLLLVNDPDVKEVAGQQRQLAIAKSKLTKENHICDYAEKIYIRVCGYYDALKLAQSNLDDTKRDLMSQLAVIKRQIEMGEANSRQFPVDHIPDTKSKQIEQELAEALGPAGTASF